MTNNKNYCIIQLEKRKENKKMLNFYERMNLNTEELYKRYNELTKTSYQKWLESEEGQAQMKKEFEYKMKKVLDK